MTAEVGYRDSRRISGSKQGAQPEPRGDQLQRVADWQKSQWELPIESRRAQGVGAWVAAICDLPILRREAEKQRQRSSSESPD